MSIKHFEDLPVLKIEELLKSRFSGHFYTEKVDGSQLLFGMDEKGFYTSRETKGGKRMYSISDYEMTFENTHRRAAHLALFLNLPSLIGAGLKPGVQVEVEVLYGRTPNVVSYDKNYSRIIFLRVTEGKIDFRRLELEFSGQTLRIPLLSPFTTDGMTIDYKVIETSWQICMPLNCDFTYMHSEAVLAPFSAYLEQDAGNGMPVRDIITVKLNRVKVAERDAMRKIREYHLEYISNNFIAPIKESLCELLVRYGSEYGDEDSWIEGVVFTDKTTGEMFKVVDKSTFGVVREFVWKARNDLYSLKDPSREQIKQLLDKYNNERSSYKLSHPLVGEFDYSDEFHVRTLEAFASKYNRAT